MLLCPIAIHSGEMKHSVAGVVVVRFGAWLHNRSTTWSPVMAAAAGTGTVTTCGTTACQRHDLCDGHSGHSACSLCTGVTGQDSSRLGGTGVDQGRESSRRPERRIVHCWISNYLHAPTRKTAVDRGVDSIMIVWSPTCNLNDSLKPGSVPTFVLSSPSCILTWRTQARLVF